MKTITIFFFQMRSGFKNARDGFFCFVSSGTVLAGGFSGAGGAPRTVTRIRFTRVGVHRSDRKLC